MKRLSQNLPQVIQPVASSSTIEAVDWHQDYLALLPAIRRHALLRFRSLKPELREELVQESIARSVRDYVRMRARGKNGRIYAGPLATFAVKHVSSGRQLGARFSSRDVSSRYCQHRHGIRAQSLSARNASGWSEVLVENRRITPAEIAAARIDVRAWLSTLPRRTRELAERLAWGTTTQDAARDFGITPGRVSQLRRELERRWHEFQGELPAST